MSVNECSEKMDCRMTAFVDDHLVVFLEVQVLPTSRRRVRIVRLFVVLFSFWRNSLYGSAVFL